MQEFLSSLRHALSHPIANEAQLVHFLVDVRNVIELGGSDFKRLKFYCSWPLHTEMTYPPVKEIIEWLDGLMDGAAMNPTKALRMMNEAYRFTSLGSLRDELFAFLMKHQLDTSLILNSNRWLQFLSLYVARVARTPLVDKRGSFRNLDEIRVLRLDTPSTAQRQNDQFLFGIEWFFMHKGIRKLPLVNDVLR
jgi:hypothetical protein